MIKRLDFKKVRRFFTKKPVIISLAVLSAILVTFLIYSLFYLGKIFPGIKIAGFPVSGLTTNEAYTELSENISLPDKAKLFHQKSFFEIELNTIEFSYDIPATTEKAYLLDRTGIIFNDFLNRLHAPTRSENLPITTSLNEDRLLEYLTIISEELGQEPVYPVAKIIKDTIVVEKGRIGTQMDLELLKSTIINNLSVLINDPITIPFVIIDPTISDVQAQSLKKRAENLSGKKVVISTEDQSFVFEGNELLKLIDPTGDYSERELLALIETISYEVNHAPENAVFVFESDKVLEFAPARDGLEVEEEKLLLEIKLALDILENDNQDIVTSEIPLSVTTPDITLDSINNLGIHELLGRGNSQFRGSISSRIHNIRVASSRFDGVLILPGETFSFNEVLGDVSAYTGYKQAYIIKDGRTVLGDGGGVCQVSTTLFRAALNSGLPIVNRRAHSYRVAYYEQDSLPGLDATVYAPYTDLKFKNDTPGHLLIQTQFDSTTASLAFEVYGTSDERASAVTKPVITSTSPPPEDLYVDDPTLPAGTIKQIDYKAWGANVYFDYEVTRGEETIYEKTFFSNFRPWQAVYLRGTGPVN